MSAFVKIPSGDVIRYVNKQYMTEADWSLYMTARDEKITKELGPKLKKKETLAESSLRMVNELLTS